MQASVNLNSARKESLLGPIAVFFSIALIMSNITAGKIASIWGLNITAGLIFFPLTYIFDDIITEVYGFKKSRRVIWMAFAANLFFILGIRLAILLPYNTEVWNAQNAYQAVFDIGPRILFASSLSYLLGGFTNAVILAKLKIYHQGKYFAVRAIASTICGVLIDSIAFTFLAFYGIYPVEVIIEIILVEMAIKVTYEVIALPITKRVVLWLKKREQIDHYDYGTRFNPFGLSE